MSSRSSAGGTQESDRQAFYQQDYISTDITSGNRNLLDQMLGHIKPERPGICETRHVTTMLGMVEAGIGIAAVPAMSMPL